eukprot:scaffold411781_cov19-Prasinocladus_malaysianus.AAC.1
MSTSTVLVATSKWASQLEVSLRLYFAGHVRTPRIISWLEIDLTSKASKFSGDPDEPKPDGGMVLVLVSQEYDTYK